MTEPRTTTPTHRTVLLTGATGYIGGHLVEPLLERGYRVRTLTRHADRLDGMPWRDRVEVVEGDATRAADLDRALDGVDVAYYLLHSMDGGGNFRERDARLAHTFADACARAGVGRIVYLGGLHPDVPDDELSEHLASRKEVGDIFLASPVPTACLQAGVVLGDGSASFDMLRHLTERLPAFVAPKWLRNRIQPIAIDDAVHYLVGAADLPPEVNRTFDIGGPDVLTYADMMQRFAKVTGRRRRIIVTLPVLTPGLASHWVGLVTPVPAGVARPLVGSLVHECVCSEHDLDQYVGPPPGGPTSFDDAVRSAMAEATPSTGPRNLAVSAAAVTATAAVGAWATDPDDSWYASLDLPPWQPPRAAFPLVWTPLFADLAGVSASAITTFEDDGRPQLATGYRRALGVNLALNAAWSVLFFRAHRPWVAAAGAAALTASSADLTRRAAQASPGHGRMLAAYPAWCAFATVLSTAIARRNPRH